MRTRKTTTKAENEKGVRDRRERNGEGAGSRGELT